MNIYDLSLDDSIYITNDISAALQELDMLFNTKQTELLGDVTYGTNFEQFLWQLTPSIDSVKKYIVQKIDGTIYLSQMDYDVVVSTTTGNYRDIYEVAITINTDDDTSTPCQRVYQFR